MAKPPPITATLTETETTLRIFSSRSRLSNSKILSGPNGEVILETYEFEEIREHPADDTHLVSSGEELNLPLISDQHYGTPDLWWVIATANDLYDVLDELQPGTVLRIPAAETVFGVLLAR